jgi:two-component system, response regulator, stage 0 sporulation protein A
MGNVKVFIAEENRNLAEIICESINKQDNYDVINVVHDGESCIGSTRINEADILILSDLLPVVDGLTVLQELKKRAVKLPTVIFISAFTSQYVLNQAKRAGVDLIIQKPFEMDHLINHMKRLNPPKGKQRYAEDDLQNLIAKCLLMIGIPRHLVGFHYLLESVEMIVKDRILEGSLTTKVFPVISKNHHVSASTVAKRIDYAIHYSWTRSEKKQKELNRVTKIMEYFSCEPSICEVIGLVIHILLPKFTHYEK